MINWKEMSGLHVINKMNAIVSKWFGMELLFADSHAKLVSGHSDKGYPYKSPFFKSQMNMPYGHEYVGADLEKFHEYFEAVDGHAWKAFDTFFPYVKALACKVVIEGEYVGTVVAYPFFMKDVTAPEMEEVVKKMVECGASYEDAKNVVWNMKKIDDTSFEYVKELIELVSGEISTYHEEISKRENRIQDLNSELTEKYRYHHMVGKSKKMQQIYNLLQKISTSESSVLIQGENGTGKELVAKAVHYFSPRKDHLFLAVNCSAFNDNLLDSELFGHVKGAFTGAIKDKKGFFEQAHGGTLFLDEIGDTSLSMQVKLLRVLQEGTFLPVGASTPKKCDVRIIAATNRNLKEMMAKGEFREDLFYRINVINVALPPLRERPEDISYLMDYFIEKRCAESGLPTKTFSKKCIEKMLDYKWPGNVRELENEVERLVVLAGDDKIITPDLLSSRILEFGDAPAAGGQFKGLNTNGSLKQAAEELEILMIQEGLKRTGFNKSKLAKELGISRASLIMKVEKYELEKRKKVG